MTYQHKYISENRCRVLRKEGSAKATIYVCELIASNTGDVPLIFRQSKDVFVKEWRKMSGV